MTIMPPPMTVITPDPLKCVPSLFCAGESGPPHVPGARCRPFRITSLNTAFTPASRISSGSREVPQSVKNPSDPSWSDSRNCCCA